MNTYYDFITLQNGKAVELAYKNLTPNFKMPRLFEPLRNSNDASKWFLAYDQIYSWSDSSDAVKLKKKLLHLPKYLLEVCFEFGVEIIPIRNTEARESIVSYRNKRIRIQIETFKDMYPAGCYEPGARLVTVFYEVLDNNDYNPLAYFMAKAYQHAILSNQNLLKTPEHHISYENRFLPYYVIRYALKKDMEYFPYSVEAFISDHRWAELKENDRPMFRFLEMLFGKHGSTLEYEELTGIKQKY